VTVRSDILQKQTFVGKLGPEFWPSETHDLAAPIQRGFWAGYSHREFWASGARQHQCLVQTGPASLVNVLLSENQPFAAIEGAP
jgi:hypothetical protein